MILELPEDALTSWRKKAYDRFSGLGFPTSALEKIWPKRAEKKEVEKSSLPIFSEYHIVFVDGFYHSALSNVAPGIVCLPLDAALKSYGLFLQNRWTRTYKEENDPFFVLNGAQQGGGAFLYIPPKMEASLQILQVFTGSNLASPRMQITLGKEASLSLIQTTQSFSETPFLNSAIDISLESGAKAKLTDLQLLPKGGHFFTGIRSTMKRDARFELSHMGNGSEQSRLSAHFELAEENSSVLFHALAMLSEERQSHINARVEHAAPHCQSHQHIKMALGGKSRSSFEGKIYVHPIAQKTEAYQRHNNLLLSDEAHAGGKPNLEIFADDVKASHGATFSQLDQEALLYLRSRGIGPSEAKSLLVEGFCRELIDLVEEPCRSLLLDEMKRALR